MNKPLLLDVPGVNNFRDQGGYALERGRMKTGRLFRCGHLADITDEGREKVAALNIALVVDLRDDHERNGFPTPLDLGPDIGAFPGGLVHADSDTALEARFTEDDVKAYKMEFCQSVPHRFPNAIKAVFETLAAGQNVLVHCTAGKDRTGVVCASVTRAIGLPMETLLKDYLATMEYEAQMEPHRVDALDEFYGFKNADPVLYGLRRKIFPELMEESLRIMEQDFGGHDTYLTDQCGVDKHALQEVRRQLVQHD
ncbi:MAG: tyrosine-protein phosphatase [Alphaproteobacteria bacterium]